LEASPQISRLLEVKPSGSLHPATVSAEIAKAITLLKTHRQTLEELAHQRAETLLQDHRRVREAARDHGSYSVTPSLPVDVIGVYVLRPNSF
jgi:hypothetical protein